MNADEFCRKGNVLHADTLHAMLEVRCMSQSHFLICPAMSRKVKIPCRDEADEEEEDDDEEYEDEEEDEEAEGGEEAAAADPDSEGADETSLGGDDFDDDDEEYNDLSKGTFFCAEVQANGLPIGPGVPTEVS